MSDRTPVLRLTSGGAGWTVPPAPEGTLVGRGGRSVVMVAGDGVSREHALIGYGGGEWWIEDVPSGASTQLDGRVLTARAVLRDGSVIGLGPSREVVVHLPVATAPQGTPPTPGTVLTLRPGQVLTIGRDPDNDVVVDDLLVSRHHARVRGGADGVHLVEDLGSSNGTYVDGHGVGTADVTPGQRISIGHTQLRVTGSSLVREQEEERVSFAADHLSVVVGRGKVLLDDVSFRLPPGSLVAVIGPSGAGKSTLLGALTGTRPATRGHVGYGGRDLYADYDELKQRIGIVPQDDIVHRQLTVRAALGYSAELRFPDDVTAAQRRGEVDRVMEELGLTAHAGTRIERLSGGQRKRVSVAMELLTKPSLIFLDEPTSGLDPGMDRALMQNLQRLAHEGRTVLVITHSTENLGLADRVFALAPGGRLAYQGPPAELLEHFGAQTHADVFEALEALPSAPDRQPTAPTTPLRTEEVAHSEAPRQQSATRQFGTVLRRQLRVTAADPGFLALTFLMPVALGLLTWLVPGSQVFEPQAPGATPSSSPLQVLMILSIGAAFIGVSGSIRALVGERPVFTREHAVGLRPGAYLAAKLTFATVVAVLQCLVMVALCLSHVGTPAHHIAAPSLVELTVAMALCAAACTALGFVFSAVTSSTDQVMPTLVVAIMVMLVLSGGLFPLDGRAGLEQVAWLSPTRWGFAMGASSVDVRGLTATAAPDPLWAHGADVYGVSALACTALLVVLTGLALLLVGRSARRS